MPEIFDKEKRAKANHEIHSTRLAFEYIQALEEVAKAAVTVWKDGYVLSSAQEAALYDSLSKVDWMNEE